MRKFLWILLIPMFLFGAVDTIEFRRVDLFENPQGYDHEIWSTWLRDTTVDTNEMGWLDTIFGDYYSDTIGWTGAATGTLFVNTAIEVGRFNTFSLYMTGVADSLDSFRIEYHPANVLADFTTIPWDWREDTTYWVHNDSLVHRAVLCVPFFKWIKWRFIDLTTNGERHVWRIYFNLKESG